MIDQASPVALLLAIQSAGHAYIWPLEIDRCIAAGGPVERFHLTNQLLDVVALRESQAAT